MSKPMVQVSVTNFHFVKPGLIVGVNGALVIFLLTDLVTLPGLSMLVRKIC